MAFDFKKSLIKVQGGRTYLPVSARIVWFREEHPDWGIETDIVEINHEKQYAVFRARIYNAEGKLMATGTKREDVKGFGDFIEKAETGSVGRALALCGFGTQFSPELDEVGGGRIVDSPYPVGGNRFGGNGGGNGGGRFDGNGGGNRFGGDGNGSRFAPPREVSAPVREESPSRSAPPRDEAPRPAQATARPAPVIDEDEDEIDALVGVTEDDPFGEDAEAAPAPVRGSAAPARPASAAPAAPAGTPACINCSKALTRSQMELSVRNYGEALCPACQRERPRAERAPATVH